MFSFSVNLQILIKILLKIKRENNVSRIITNLKPENIKKIQSHSFFKYKLININF